MKKNFIIPILSWVFIAFLFFACDEQEVADPISTDNYPVATITSDFTGTEVTEGDTIVFTITLDKMLDADLNFELVLDGASTVSETDFVVNSVRIAPYSLEGTMTLIVPYDGIAENDEVLNFEIGMFDLAERYLVKPGTSRLTQNLTVKNYNDPNLVVVAIGWENHENDLDIFAIHETEGDWSLAGSSDNPEIMPVIEVDGDNPDGKYYITVDPYHFEGNTDNLTFYISYPDGSIEILTAVFDITKLDEYTVDYFAYWDVNTYRVLTLTKTGTSYAVALDI
jgi:hypothetical protein